MKRILVLFTFFLLTGVLFVGCATHTLGNVDNPPGFFKGLLHGFILFFSFIASLFTDYEIYAFPNTGGWYNFGFLLGVMFFFSGSGAGAKRKC